MLALQLKIEYHFSGYKIWKKIALPGHITGSVPFFDCQKYNIVC